MQELARASLTWEEGCATRRITRVVGPRGALDFGRVTISIILGWGMIIRYCPRFFDQVGHQTTSAYIEENKHFFH